MRLVLDASAAVRVVMRAEHTPFLLDTLAGAAVVTAPSLFSSEVANALWKYIQAGTIPLETAIGRYEEAVTLVDDFTPDAELVTEALAEAARRSHPVYDLLYAVLARRHGCDVLTLDKRLIALLEGMEISVVQL